MGLGYISLLARSIELELAERVRRAQGLALGLQRDFRIELEALGISFGFITATPEGTLGTDEVRGISDDLVVRPFGLKGRHSTLEELVDEALQIHHGHQSASRVDNFRGQSEFIGNGSAFDPDQDGIQGELSEAQPMLLAAYLSMLPVPKLSPPADPELALQSGRGLALFRSSGCSECHRPKLYFRDWTTRIRSTGGTEYSFELDLETHGIEPRPARVDFSPDDDGAARLGVPVFAFTDLRRHDLGAALADSVDETLPDRSGVIPGSVWLTRPLWGLADTAPYLHDGRAPTVHDAIVWHGGEARESREAYEALPEEDQAALRVFLMSLRRDPVVLVE